MKWVKIVGICLLAGPVSAEAPKVSVRPVARLEAQAVTASDQNTAVQEAAPAEQTPKKKGGLFAALRPKSRSDDAPKQSRAESTKSSKTQTGKGICGNPALVGEYVGRVPSKVKGCGLSEAVKVRQVDGIKLSTPAVMDCNTAASLHKWIKSGARPAVGKKGGGLVELQVAASYACRPRNNQKGAKISEHGRGRAIDISGFKLANGETVSLIKGWNTKAYGGILRKMHKSACGPFGTVLGPNVKFHKDHFHFDTARYRNGTYCK